MTKINFKTGYFVGAVGLTENPSQLLKWMVAGPELARIVNEFEDSLPFNKVKEITDETKHHEQTEGMQQRFSTHVSTFLSCFEDIGNPFLEESQDLIALDTKDVAEEVAIVNLNKAEVVGKEMFNVFVKDHIKGNDKSIFDTISKNKLAIFSQPKQRSISNKDELTTLKKSCHLFSQLYIACQVRDGNLDEFFAHENTAFPPLLSKNGNLRSGNKADLTTCLREVVTETGPQKVDTDCLILDGAAIVNILKPTRASTFHDYSKEFTQFIKNQITNVNRLDIVWDIYIEKSLKLSARTKRGL